MSQSISKLTILIALTLCCISICFVQAQETYELSAPGMDQSSIAKIDAHELVIRDASGQITRYQRLPRYDSADQQFISYSSRAAQQVIQWPTSNSGHMKIGTLQNGRIQFSMSKMTIIPIQHRGDDSGNVLPGSSFGPGLGESANHAADFARMRDAARSGASMGPALESLPMTAIQLAAGEINDRQFLAANTSGRLLFDRSANDLSSAWYIVPVGNDMVRLQQRQNNQWAALGIDDVVVNQINQGVFGNRFGFGHAGPAFGSGGFPGGGSFGGGGALNNQFKHPQISLFPIQNNPNQLWHLTSGMGGGYCFESVLYPGYGLTYLPGSGLILQPMVYNPYQVWWPQQPAFALPAPQFRTVDHRIIPNPPLAPVTVRFTNTHSETLVALITDRRNLKQQQKLRIPAGLVEQVQLDRDAGATIVETVEMMDSFGNWNREQYQTPIPPKVIYDVSVYEEFLQSIAIDRTGKSPNAIEDINYQPRSIGFFLIPPGDSVQNFSEVDTYHVAEDAKNPGAVRKLNPRDLPNPSSQATPVDPLKDLLNQFQRKRAAF